MAHEIKTFAILDLETNNLLDYNFNKVNITEIAINAISKDVLIGNEIESPRIVHKLTLLFNPRALITPTASSKTGLDNYMLEHENNFDKNAAETICGFIRHLPNPVCLVAHNGNEFDFPVLKRCLDKLEMPMPENVLCIDSYIAISKIDNDRLLQKNIEKDKEENATKISDTNKINEEPFQINASENVEVKVKIEAQNLPHKEIDDFENDLEFLKHLESEYRTVSIETKLTEVDDMKSMQLLNETTPKRSRIPSNASEIKNGKHTEQNNDRNQARLGVKSKKRLFASTSSTPAVDNNIQPKPKKGFYVLENVYKRLFNCEATVAHQAEADVKMLMKILSHYGEELVEYAEHNAILFSATKQTGTPQAKKKV